MNIAEQIHLKLQLKESSEIEYKSAAGGFPKAEFWRSFSALANTNGGTIVLGVKEKNHKFTPDGLSEELVTKYRKQFWDDAHNKSCVNIPRLMMLQQKKARPTMLQKKKSRNAAQFTM